MAAATIPASAMAMLPMPAAACTFCHSRLAEDVRMAVFGPGFWGDAAAVISPFPMLVAAMLVLRRLLP